MNYQNESKKFNYQNGGKPFDKYQFDTKDEFTIWYNSQHKSSLQLLIEQLIEFPIGSSRPLNDGPFNVLVGCTNSDNNDYSRFINSNFYSLFIDSGISIPFEGSRQYDMYTILYEDLIDQLRNIPQNIVLNIHFDTEVSYFCPADQYFKIASHLLVPGGKIVFNYGINHSGINFHIYNKSTNSFRSMSHSINLSIKELQDRYNVIIDTDKKEIIFDRMSYIRNNIDPQYNLSILYRNENDQLVRFKNIFGYKYIDYLRETYPEFNFEKKIYTFKNYTYPVPIRILEDNGKILIFNTEVEFIFNEIMSYEERLEYIETKIITDDLINQLSSRIFRNQELKTKFCNLLNIYEYEISEDIIKMFIDSILLVKYKYIEAIKH